VTHTIGRTLLALGAGIVVQRGCQLVAFALAGHALGVSGLGVFAQGLAMAAVMTVIAGAGVNNLTARALAAEPGAARGLIAAAVRRRMNLGVVLAGLVMLVTGLSSEQPLFWWLCAMHVLPAAFDVKQLADSVGRTRQEVALETGASVLNLFAVAIVTSLGAASLEWLAGISLATRLVHAAGAAMAMRRLPGSDEAPTAPVWRLRPALGQMAHEAMAMGDVWIVAALIGDEAAGYYALGSRFAAAALLPSMQLARLLLPHVLHAGADGNAPHTLATALRATAFATLPMLAGAIVTARTLCCICGDQFAAAAPTLCLLLLAGTLQHIGWQCSNTLLARGSDIAFARLFGWPALLHALLLVLFPTMVPAREAAGALLAAIAAVLAHATYAVVGLVLLRPLWLNRPGLLRRPLLLAIGTGTTAALPLTFGDGWLLLPAQLLTGACGFVIGLWHLELRGRWRTIGDGLAAASGLRI